MKSSPQLVLCGLFLLACSHPSFAADLLDFLWSGGLSATSAVVVAKTSDHSGTNACRLAVYSDPSFTTEVFRSPSATPATSQHNSVVKLEVTSGLAADTIYYYRIEVNGIEDDVNTGRFRTCPKEGEVGGNFRVAFANSNNDPDSVVYDWLKLYDPLFFIYTGDFHYEDINDANETVALNRHQAAYEENLDVTGHAASQADLHRHVAVGYMWDDHDFGPNDCHAKGSVASRRATPEAQAAVHTAYRRYIPHWPIGLDAHPNFAPGRAPVAQAFTVGRVRFIVSDLRSQSEQNGSTSYDATLMGSEQKAWFKEELLKASGTYPLIVWLTSVPWIGAQTTVTGNKWFQHTGERAEIANFIKDNHIRGFSAIGGDAHMVAIDDGSHTDFATGGGAGFPIIHAAPIGTRISYKGGPYSEGASASSIHQYGCIEVEDRTNELVAVFSGLNGPSGVADIIISDHADNLGNPLTYAFTNSRPVIKRLAPGDDATGVGTHTRLIVTFNEPVVKGSGNLKIHRLSDDVVEQIIFVASDAISVTGNEVTIFPPAPLTGSTAYYITMDEGILTDGAAAFAGLYAPTSLTYRRWNFTTFADGDGDGLPDPWEMLYFGGATNAIPGATCSNGVNTVVEAYIAGINPTDPGSFFVVAGVQRTPQSTISWPSVSGRVYSVYWTPAVPAGFDLLQSGVPWTPGAFTDALHGSESPSFYKLGVEIDP